MLIRVSKVTPPLKHRAAEKGSKKESLEAAQEGHLGSLLGLFGGTDLGLKRIQVHQMTLRERFDGREAASATFYVFKRLPLFAFLKTRFWHRRGPAKASASHWDRLGALLIPWRPEW